MSRLGCLIAAAVAILFPTGYGIYGKLHDDRLSTTMERVKRSMPAEAAVRLLGRPSWRAGCGSRFPYSFASDCSTEIVYASSFAPLNPLYWVVEVDRQNRVISAELIGSP
ncbi:MAG TPA: hypothetical protein VH331_15950 [Allosphingosinicella sp.]|nr:hypothetical protein [Allosphingosinicella sp.]